MPTSPRVRYAAALLLALGLAAGCGGGGDATPAAQASPSARDLAKYDAFVLASEINDVAAADVYGIKFSPFSIDRITTDKAISALGADERHVIVAAADEQVDKLAEVTGAGELAPIEGLGRPIGYSPTIRDGLVYFDDAEGVRGDRFRFFTFDLAKRKKTLVYSSAEDLGAPKPMADGRLLLTVAGKNGEDGLAIRDKSGKITALPTLGKIAVVRPGRDYVAVTLVRNNKDGASQALLLFNPENGEKQIIPNLQMVAWSPDGRQFLARRTETPTESRLVLLDPKKDPVELGTVPELSIFGGTWVRGSLPA
ncbi:MAG: hypothetical protein ACT4QG_22170 [Sporichthyaceae bacterium]